MCENLFLKIFNDAKKCDCSDGAVLFWAENRNEKDYEGFCGELEEKGFARYAARCENGNVFSTYYKDGKIINTYFTPCDGKIRMISESGENLPPCAEDNTCERRVSPLITQMKNINLLKDCCMAYVIRLCDGRFVLIDTMSDEYEAAESILETLKEQNTVYEKPVLAACFFTHAHEDHFGAFLRIMKEHADEVVFGDIIYNWPNHENLENISCISDHTEFDEYVKKMTGANVIKVRSGQRFCYADTVFDILYTCDDLYPNVIKNLNDTSTVMRMEMNGRRVMWLGDAQVEASACICERYGADSLKSEIMQVAHHGFWGGSAELYRNIDADVLLWPVPDFWYHEAINWEPNVVLFESEQPKKIFISGRYQTTLDMTKPIPNVPPIPKYKSGDVVYSENFATKRVIDLNWVAVTGGSTGYKGAKLELCEGGCIWSAAAGERTVLEILRPFAIEDAEEYSMKIRGEVYDKPEEFGVMYNYGKPTVWSGEHLVEFGAECGKFECELTTGNDGAKIYRNGELIHEAEYSPCKNRGLYLVLKGGKVKIESIEITKK